MQLEDKIRALLESPNEGERAAARAALARLPAQKSKYGWVPDLPPYGSTDWHEGVVEWNKLIDWTASRWSSPCLNEQEVIVLRNWARGRGTPWGIGSREFLAIYEKLRENESSPVLYIGDH